MGRQKIPIGISENYPKNEKQIAHVLANSVKNFLSSFKQLMQKYFGVKYEFKHTQESDIFHLENLKEDLQTLQDGVKNLYIDFNHKITNKTH